MSKAVNTKTKETALLFGTFLIAICGLIYELLNGTLSSYLLGDSIYHFSLVIGLFMSSMGIGAWLSRFIEEELERAFVRLQLIISLLGGFSAFILFYAFAYINNYDAFLYLITISLGTMLGIEIPLIIRILKESFSLKTNISNVFTVDYIGALFASLIFPLVLVPKLGLMQTSFLFGMINLFVGAMAWYIFREILGRRYILYLFAVLAILVIGFWQSTNLTNMIENKLYRNKIIYKEQTPYQKIVVTAHNERIQFYINGAIQFDSIDEYRYHESLVHPVMITAKAHENVLIIGGGDGMALREVLKYEEVEKITLVDLDPAITTLFRENQTLSQLNDHAYESPKVTVVNQDAWKYIEKSKTLYDVIIIDLPDPNSISLSRLYSKTFYHLLKKQLSKGGAMVTQASSPMYTHKAFWSINETIKSTDLYTLPYHTYIPSFGEWGFVLASRFPIKLDGRELTKDLKYLDETTLNKLTTFAPDIAKVEVEENRLSTHRLIEYYNEGWKRWYH
ncbi:polyamine aminopropyltransferase [Sulfurovum sp. bin170]|uniref:polyamine aminopropyltransferase n=1 Tax=Sulfurovum sp. bin170 TaxID=2695268 RepID=UPI0013DFB3D2|nr:polyamine aminopropyltransferase [Sulfurovum sp. bin170]NEW60462.1 polyamine aminopropyltransferase [Sulfurovum sp. bin170]